METKLSIFHNLRRSPSFCFVTLLMMYFIFQMGVYVGRTWPNFPCPAQSDESFETVSVKMTMALPVVNKMNKTVFKRVTRKFSPKVLPIRKTTITPVEEMRPNNAIVFEENFVAAPTVISTNGAKSNQQTTTNARHDEGLTPRKIELKRIDEPLKLIVQNDYDLLAGNADIGIPDYIQIREADTPKYGDFDCGGTVIPHCCAHYVVDIAEAKKVCHSYSDYCKGFVLSTMSSSSTNIRYLMYLKTDVSKMCSNFLTDFFVKSKFMKEIDWKVQKRNA